jgi:hypothetical protein
MFNFMGISMIMEAAGRVFLNAVALVQLPEQQAADIGGDPAPGKIGNNFLGKKTFKPELVMADCSIGFPCREDVCLATTEF